MLAKNKHLKSLASRGVSSVETEIQDLWDELMQLKKENLAELQNARKIMTRAYMFAYVSWLLFVVIFF